MARPTQNKVSYFPHPVTHSKKMSYLEKKYKNDGYAVWFKLLEELGNTDYHYLDLSDEVQVMFLADKCLVSESTLFDIIEDLVKFREFNKVLWKENKILYNQKFVDSIEDAYNKRKNKCINENSLFLLLEGLGVRKPSKSIRKPCKSTLKGSGNTQSKVEYNKEDKNRLNKTKLNNTLLSEINISDLESNEVEYFEIAVAFQNLFIKNLEETQAPTLHQKNAKYKNYVNPIRLMIQNDGVTKEKFQKVFKYLNSPDGDFWKPNILSTKKLREKFPQLMLKAQTQINGKQTNNTTARATEDYKARIKKVLSGTQS